MNAVLDLQAFRIEVKRLMQAKDYAAAEAVTEPFVQQFSHEIGILTLMMKILKPQEKYARMVQLGAQVMALDSQYDETGFLLDYGVALQKEGHMKSSIAINQRVLLQCDAQAPSDAVNLARVDLLYNIAMAYDSLGEFDKAKEHYDAALTVNPSHSGSLFGREMLQIKCSNLRHDFEHYNTRFLLTGQVRNEGYPCPQWQGEDVAGKRMVIWSEQGIGDVAMFAGFVPYLLQKTEHLTLEVASYFVEMFRRSFPQAEVVAKAEGVPADAVQQGRYDFHAPMGDLLRMLAQYQPRAARGYLKPCPERVAELKARYAQSGKKTVGISWRTIQPDSRFRRNIPLELWGPILQVPDVRFVSLQYSGEHEELDYVKRKMGIDILLDETVDPMKNRDDFFAQVAAMDAVVSIQNSTVHAGGATGIPTAIMLSKSGDFRWGVSLQESVWYESVSILRQREYGDWTPVIEQAAQWLKDG